MTTFFQLYLKVRNVNVAILRAQRKGQCAIPRAHALSSRSCESDCLPWGTTLSKSSEYPGIGGSSKLPTILRGWKLILL